MSTMNALEPRSGEIALWAINQQPEQSARFVASSEGVITIRIIGRVSSNRSGEVTINVTKAQAEELLALHCPLSELHMTAQRVLPFIELSDCDAVYENFLDQAARNLGCKGFSERLQVTGSNYGISGHECRGYRRISSRRTCG
jgi:hypothetical protein